jgi:phosphate transport system substrate-binding protein
MAFTRGRCTNFDYCSIAEARKDVEVRVGEDFVCPECGKPLKAPQLKSGGASPMVPALVGIGVLVLIGGAVFLGMRMGSSGAPAQKLAESTAQMPAPVPAPIPLAPASPPPTAMAAVPAPPPLPAENVLARIHGAAGMGTSVVAPLASAYLTEIGDTAIKTADHAGEIRVSGLRGGIRETIVIVGDGVGDGFTALAKGGADLVMAPRRILPAEQANLAGLGDMMSPSAEHVLAVDAQAVVVHPGNRVASLSRAQITSIFDGSAKDWRDFGGPAGPIDVYAAQLPPDSDPSGGIAPGASSAIKRLADDQAVSQAVAADPNGVGLVDLAAIGSTRAVPVAETGAAPIDPAANHAALVSGDYPLAFKLYLYSSPKAEGGFAQRFVAYALSPAGQTVAEAHGLVSPTAPPAAAAPPPQAAPPQAAPPQAAPPQATDADRLKAFVAGAKRLAVVFRFEPNSTVLDPHGERDLDRVLNYLVSLHDGGDHLLLAGFADNQGDAAANLDVSKKRADAVAALFVRRGLTPGGVQGFGAELPVANNATEAGRERNRRVEVYIKP